jgi:hypothetical protein
MKKKLSELIDELSITNFKIFHLMEVGTDLQKVKRLNAYRSRLKGAIDEYFNEEKEIKV